MKKEYWILLVIALLAVSYFVWVKMKKESIPSANQNLTDTERFTIDSYKAQIKSASKNPLAQEQKTVAENWDITSDEYRIVELFYLMKQGGNLPPKATIEKILPTLLSELNARSKISAIVLQNYN